MNTITISHNAQTFAALPICFQILKHMPHILWSPALKLNARLPRLWVYCLVPEMCDATPQNLKNIHQINFRLVCSTRDQQLAHRAVKWIGFAAYIATKTFVLLFSIYIQVIYIVSVIIKCGYILFGCCQMSGRNNVCARGQSVSRLWHNW